MRFVFFHLMPYPYLPDDFDEYPSISLTFPNKHFDRDLGTKLYHRYLDELEHAEVAGFDGLAVNEHHQSAYGLMPSPNIMAAALSRRTERARIMVLGNAIGIRGNPLRVAEEIAMLDHLTDGRLTSGFVRGIGWEYFAHSINPTRSRARFNEAHDLIIKAWTSDEMFQWIGDNYEYRYVNLWPRPLQQPHPPIYIPGAGSSETFRFVAEHGYTFMSVYTPVRVIKRWFDSFREISAEAGNPADPSKIAFSVPVYVAPTDEQARRDAEPAVLAVPQGAQAGPGDRLPAGVHVAVVVPRRAVLRRTGEPGSVVRGADRQRHGGRGQPGDRREPPRRAAGRPRVRRAHRVVRDRGPAARKGRGEYGPVRLRRDAQDQGAGGGSGGLSSSSRARPASS